MVQKREVEMSSITIHNLDHKLDCVLRKKANSQQLSLNKLIQKLLKQALGIDSKQNKKNTVYFKQFLGVWSGSDVKEFNRNTSGFEKIDREEW